VEEPTAFICRMEEKDTQTKNCNGYREEGARGYTIIYMTYNKNLM